MQPNHKAFLKKVNKIRNDHYGITITENNIKKHYFYKSLPELCKKYELDIKEVRKAFIKRQIIDFKGHRLVKNYRR